METNPKEIIRLLSEPKKEHPTFKFYINKNKEENNYIHDFLGQAKVPLIGKYQHADYAFGDVLSLITFTFDMNPASLSQIENFKPPKEIYDYLNVNEVITIDDNTHNSHNNQFYPKDKVKFHFIITSSPSNYQSTNDQLNIVPHVFLGHTLDFSKQKRVVFNTPMTLFIPSDIEKSSGISEKAYKDKNNIDINNLRVEFSSIHMKGESLAFSPNNLKFNMNTSLTMTHFYILITLKETDYHHLFYYIVINKKEAIVKTEKMLQECQTLNDIIKGLEESLGKETNTKEIIENLKQLFN